MFQSKFHELLHASAGARRVFIEGFVEYMSERQLFLVKL